jgi:hypothetical protein
MLPGPPPGLRALVGVAEVADLLGVSRQRADTLTRGKGFPDPVTLVLPLDGVTFDTMRELFAQLGDSVGVEQAIELITVRGFKLPETPRLWRLSVVRAWAEEDGRQLRDGGAPTA